MHIHEVQADKVCHLMTISSSSFVKLAFNLEDC